MPKTSKIRTKGSGYTNAPAVKKTNSIFKCVKCGRESNRQKGFFPSSHSPLFKENNGYLPYCTVCIDQLFDHYRGKLTSEADAVRRMCEICDAYWNLNLYESVKRGEGSNLSLFRSYVSKLNLAKYLNKTFDDTLDEERLASEGIQVTDTPKKQDPEENAKKEKEKKQTVELLSNAPKPSADTLLFWGSGLTPEIYQDLNLRYQRWTRNLQAPLDDATEGLYKQLCIAEANVNQNMAGGKGVEASQKIINDILYKLGISPDKQTEDDDAYGIESTPMGVWVKRWEDKRPLPEEDEDMKDPHKIIGYINTWFLGHAGKMLGINNIHTKMYDEEIAKYRIERPDLEDEDDDEFMLDLFGSDGGDTDDTV